LILAFLAFKPGGLYYLGYKNKVKNKNNSKHICIVPKVVTSEALVYYRKEGIEKAREKNISVFSLDLNTHTLYMYNVDHVSSAFSPDQMC